MNKPVKIAETVGDVLDRMDETRVENMRVWNALGKTDPAHTKQFSRAGGFKGTAIKPIWIAQRLTEQFGPCGIGWGIGRPHFEVVHADEETLVYCTVECWHGNPGNAIYGVGGDKVVTRRKDGPFRDDEAFKKAFTDAVGNAFKFIGVAADVHMGLFEDSKYLAEVNAEFHPPSSAGMITDAQIASIEALLGKAGRTAKQVSAAFGRTELIELTAEEAGKALKRLNDIIREPVNA
jgi:hypothetical protein